MVRWFVGFKHEGVNRQSFEKWCFARSSVDGYDTGGVVMPAVAVAVGWVQQVASLVGYRLIVEQTKQQMLRFRPRSWALKKIADSLTWCRPYSSHTLKVVQRHLSSSKTCLGLAVLQISSKPLAHYRTARFSGAAQPRYECDSSERIRYWWFAWWQCARRVISVCSTVVAADLPKPTRQSWWAG